MSCSLHTLYVQQSDLNKLKKAAVDAYPEECCGLLVGTKNVGNQLRTTRVTCVVPTVNLLETDNLCLRDRFWIDPKARIALTRFLRGSQEEIVGHYHSHPNGQNTPSCTDLSMVFEPNLIWVIVAILQSRVTVVNAYCITRTTVQRIQITTTLQ